jgi:RND family efflux transporter MFP subunit
MKTIHMKNRYLPIFITAMLAIMLGACSSDSQEDNKQARLEQLKAEQAKITSEIQKLQEQILKENPEAAASKAKNVSITELQPKAFDHYIQTQGSVETDNNVMVSAKSMGVVTQIFATEGQMVSKGQVLAQIDNSIIVAGIEELESQLSLANTVFERQKNLWDQKIGTEVQFLQAKTNKESLEKRLTSLKEQNDMTRIKAPISGVLDELNVKIGENISPGMPAARIVNSTDLKVKANVSEAYVTAIKKGNKVIVIIPELKKELTAKVTFVGRSIDPISRTFSVEVQLPNHPDLRPNMTATIKIVFDSYSSALVVPVNVVQDINGEKVVYVAEVDGAQAIARKRVVEVTGVYDNQAQIKSGLATGDKVISFGYQGLSDGEIIKI